MNIKLIPPTKIDPDGFRVFHLAFGHYYMEVSIETKETALPITIWDASQKLVRIINYDGSWSLIDEKKLILNIKNPDIFLFEVDRITAHQYTWFFIKEFARNKFRLNLHYSEASIQFRHLVMVSLTRQIQQHYENTTTQS